MKPIAKAGTILLPVIIGFLFINSIKKHNELQTENTTSISIEEALEKKMISLEIRGTDTYSGNSLIMKVKNYSLDTSYYIESGRRFVSEDTLFQDILVVKPVKVRIKSGETQQFQLFGFCCQASKQAPTDAQIFTVGQMADAELQKLANFINQNAINLPLQTLQHAVWTVSDNKPIQSIHDNTPENAVRVKALQRFVADLKGIEIPWYTLTYKSDSSQLFSNRPKQLYGTFDYKLRHRCSTSLVLRDAKGRVIKLFFVDKPQNPGNNKYGLELDVSKLPKGKYYLRLYADDQLHSEKMIKL